MADSIPAMLEPGEYVLNRNAARAIGKDKLDELNYEDAPREGYQFGGSAPRNLFSRMQEGGYTIPAGKNIFGQPTEEMGMEELMEMIMPGGGAAGVLKKGAGAMKLGKAGIEQFMAKPTRREGLEAMGKFMSSGKGQKEILENARLEVVLEELKKWATGRGLFEQVVKKQQGGEVPETLLSMISGGKYGTSKDLPSIREQIIPLLELLTGAEHVPEGESAGLTDLALAIPFLGKLGKGAKAAKAAKPAMSKYYASIFGGKKVKEKEVKNYLKKMFSEEKDHVYRETKTTPIRLREVPAPKEVLAKQSPSIEDIKGSLERDAQGISNKYRQSHNYLRHSDIVSRDVSKIDRGVRGFLKEAQDAYKHYYGMQRGGSVDDYSLMDYMLPAMDKRLGPPLKRMKLGGDPSDPKYTGYMTSFAGAGRGGTQDPQSLLQQPSGSFSTGIGSIFQEAGLQTPGEDYLETLSAYDPTRQQRLQQDYGAPGIAGGTTFAKSGAEFRDISEKRELETMKLQRGAQDLRKDYREDILAQIAEDIANEEYDFTDLV
jgi:hypothetical protein